MKKIALIIFLSSTFILNINSQNSSVQALIQEGVELHDVQEYQNAIKKFEQALKINPESILALYETALSYLALEDYVNASAYSTQVINSDDKNLWVGAYAIKSEALAEMKKIDEAILLLREGLIKNGDSHLLHFNMALNYYKKGDIDRTLQHVSRAIELDKTSSGAFLLNAYAQRDKGLWVRSIFSFQMFLLLEPDSKRSRNTFEEMLQTMYVIPSSEKPVQRSFIRQQLEKNKPQEMKPAHESAPEGKIDREQVYAVITSTKDSLIAQGKDSTDIYLTFQEVNKALIKELDKQKEHIKPDSFWAFHLPFFTGILHSKHYDTYCRYISVSYLPESYKWWEENKSEAEKFIHWFEKGEPND